MDEQMKQLTKAYREELTQIEVGFDKKKRILKKTKGSNSTTADRYHRRLVREQLLVITMRIEILQSITATARIEMHQGLFP